MVISKETIKRIKRIIERNYNQFTISILGKSVFSPEELKNLNAEGLDTSNNDSLLDLIYSHNFINRHGDPKAPTSVEDMKSQQSLPGTVPEGEAHEYASEHLNENASQLIEKMNQDVQTRVEGLIRETNHQFKTNALQNLNRPDEVDDIIKEGMVSQIKQKLRDSSGDANRNWRRVAITETSNAIGAGSSDAIVARNREKDLGEVYVFRIVVGDSKLCKYCREFYLDGDGSPKLYRMSTLLNNGSNYGKKTPEWKPVVLATHPNERCSAVMELPPGYKLLSGGSMTYIGMDVWDDYIQEKLNS